MGNIEGSYDPELTPYTKLFQEAITAISAKSPKKIGGSDRLVAKGQRVDEAFVVKSSQSGFTQAALNACVYIPLHCPGRLLYAIDSREKAKRLASQRLIPLLKKLCGRVIEDNDDVWVPPSSSSPIWSLSSAAPIQCRLLLGESRPLRLRG
jgi:hypothetical protein